MSDSNQSPVEVRTDSQGNTGTALALAFLMAPAFKEIKEPTSTTGVFHESRAPAFIVLFLLVLLIGGMSYALING